MHKMHCIRTVQKRVVKINITSETNATIFHFKINGSSTLRKIQDKKDNPQTLKIKKISVVHCVVVRFPYENSPRTKDFVDQMTDSVQFFIISI